MKKFSILKAIKGKPSIALQMMIEGLQEQSKRKNFKIAMGTFGSSDYEYTCYGCAATCTIQKMAKKNFTHELITQGTDRAKFINADLDELSRFELAIDLSRKGMLYYLFQFCKIPKKNIDVLESTYDYYLGNDNWKEEIPKVKKVISILKKHNL